MHDLGDWPGRLRGVGEGAYRRGGGDVDDMRLHGEAFVGQDLLGPGEDPFADIAEQHRAACPESAGDRFAHASGSDDR